MRRDPVVTKPRPPRRADGSIDWDKMIEDQPAIDPHEPHHLFNPLPSGTSCPDGPHRGPEGPNEDLGQCSKCGHMGFAMRPGDEEFGGHLDDCALLRRHQSYCQPGGEGHPPPRVLRG